MPASWKTALTSAKSLFMMPVLVIRSVIPSSVCIAILLATRKPSKNPLPGSISPSRLSLGMMITVSTCSRSAASPASAVWDRRFPSNTNGLTAAAIVRAPICLASEAITGPAPVPVPPPQAEGQEHHVGLTHQLRELFGVLEGRFAADVRVRARAVPLGHALADAELHGSPAALQRLLVGVDAGELDVFDAGVHHEVHDVAATAAQGRRP